MPRKKVKLAFLVNDSVRKATYKKRKDSLKKKVHELCTLCDIDAALIVFNPDNPQPEIWPSPNGVNEVLIRFYQIHECEQSRKMLNHESYLKQMIDKVNLQLKKKCNENKDKETTLRMHQCLQTGKVPEDLESSQLTDLASMIDLKIKEIEVKMKELDENPMANNQSQAAPAEVDEVSMDEWEAPLNGDEGLDMILEFLKK